MSRQVYLVCEKDVAGGINRQQFSQVLQEREIEHEILPVSNRAVIDRPAISKELFSRIAWLCFSTPDAVRLFFAFFHDLHINEFSFKLAAQDLNTAAALLKQGLQTDYIPVLPLHLEQNSILNKQGELVVAVDGQEWAGLAASVNLIFTELKGLSFSIPEETKAIYFEQFRLRGFLCVKIQRRLKSVGNMAKRKLFYRLISLMKVCWKS